MIQSLTIRNIVLIEELTIRFEPGMQVLTGETGSGKSLLLNSLNLILGGRADRDLIRTGCERASVEAEFAAGSAEGLRNILDREGIEFDGESVTFYRELTAGGRNICRINGVMVPLAVLKEAAATLLNLHGQSEHQFLADEEKHLSYLDMMGDAEHRRRMEETKEAYSRFITNHRTYAKLVKMNDGRERRIDSLRRELDELHRAGIAPGEEERLTEESRRLHKASRIREKLDRICALTSGGEEGGDALHQLQTAARELSSLEGEDPAFAETASQEGFTQEAELFLERQRPLP